MVKAEVRFHNGAPTLFINDVPCFGAVHWAPTPSSTSWIGAPYVKEFADSGVHIVTICVGAGSEDAEWSDPETPDGSPYFLSRIDNRLDKILQVDPEAYFILRVELQMRPHTMRWWCEKYPDERELLGDGRQYDQSYASKIWLRDACDFLKAFVRYLRSTPSGQQVIGIQPAVGGSGEWGNDSCMENWATDYSEPMRQAFRQWLGRRYNGDQTALREAWKNPWAMFHTVEVPSPEEQEGADTYHFRDPSRGRKVMDFYECLADIVAEDIDQLCKAVKDAANGEILAGVFYGYIMEMAWSNGFFNQRLDMVHPAYQRSGHLALRKVLASPYVDFLASPLSYGFRGIGGDGVFMSLTESIRLHGKLYFAEEDTRTHLFPPNSHYGQAKNVQESISVLTRNFGNVLSRSCACWWADWVWETGPYHDPQIMQSINKFVEIGTKSLRSEDRSPSAEIAVIIDEESLFYERLIKTLDWPLIFRQRHWGFSRIGAPHDVYLHNDIENLPDQYKLYIFLNCFYLSQEEREAVKRTVRRAGKTSLWMYAAGAIKEDISLENMKDLSGINMGWEWTEWGLNLLITGFEHPITRDLPANTNWGTDGHIGPVFFVDDPETYPLGTLVYSRGTSVVGMAIKEMEGWSSIYAGAPNIPSNVLRSIAHYAGVHVFSNSDDVLHASRDFITIHTTKGEEKEILLPRTADVWDVMEDRLIAQKVKRFSDFLKAGETKTYYWGDAPWE